MARAHKETLMFESRTYKHLSDGSLDFPSLVEGIPRLVDQSLAENNITLELDAKMVGFDARLSAHIKQTYTDWTASLSGQLFRLEVTRVINIVSICLVFVFQVLQFFYFPRLNSGRKSFLAGSWAILGLVLLETSSLVMITSYMLNNIREVLLLNFPLYSSAWAVKYFDPILTGSALRFVLSSGNNTWKEKYTSVLGSLETNFNTSFSLSDTRHEVDLFNSINTANNILVALEQEVLGNSSRGSILLNDTYQENKALYLFSIEQLVTEESRRLFSAIASAASLGKALIFFAAVLCAMGFLVFVTDLSRLYVASSAVEQETQLIELNRLESTKKSSSMVEEDRSFARESAVFSSGALKSLNLMDYQALRQAAASPPPPRPLMPNQYQR